MGLLQSIDKTIINEISEQYLFIYKISKLYLSFLILWIFYKAVNNLIFGSYKPPGSDWEAQVNGDVLYQVYPISNHIINTGDQIFSFALSLIIFVFFCIFVIDKIIKK